MCQINTNTYPIVQIIEFVVMVVDLHLLLQRNLNRCSKGPFYSRRPRQACHVIANTEELPTIPIELSTKVSFVFSSPREIGELVFHGGMDPCPKTTMGVKRAEI